MDTLLDFLLHRVMRDWDVFALAAHTFLAGNNPYAVGSGVWRFFNPVWTLIPLIPLVMIPADLQPLALAVLPLAAVLLIGRLFRYRGLRLLCVLAAPALWFGIGYGQIDWLVWTGLLLPTPLALLFLAMKPQTTWLAITVLALRSRRPVSAVIPLLVGVAWWVFGYGVHIADPATNIGNISWFPLSLIVGVPLVAIALWKRNLKLAMAAGVFCSPYMSFSSLLALSLAYPVVGAVYSVFMFVTQQLH